MATVLEQEAHRQALADLTTLSTRDLLRLWRSIDPAKADLTRDALLDVLPPLVEAYGSAAGTLGADFYDNLRDAAGAAGSFSAEPATPATQDRVETLVRWGVGPLYGSGGADAALGRIAEGFQRLVADVDRRTVSENVDRDRAAYGYARHASANACAFCAMLASRGPVYSSEGAAGAVTGRSLGGKDYRALRRAGGLLTRDAIYAGSRKSVKERGGRALRSGLKRGVGEKYHDACHCVAVPVWSPSQYEAAPHVQRWKSAYDESVRLEGSKGAVDVTATLSEMRQVLGTN